MAREKKTPLKTTELRFKVRAIRQLLSHAQSCTEYLPLQAGDNENQGPGLVFVGELSVYMASNGKDDTPLDAGNRIVYAEEMDPANWDDEFELIARKVEMVGVSDEVVFLKAADVETVLGKSEDWELLRICVVHDGNRMHKALMLPTGRPANSMAKAW